MSVDTDFNVSPVLGTSKDDDLIGTGGDPELLELVEHDSIQALSGDD